MVGLTIKQSIIANPFLIYFGAISQHSPTETVGVSILWSARFPPKEGIIDADHFLQDEFEVTIIDWESRAGIQVTGSTVLRSLLLDGMMIGAFF